MEGFLGKAVKGNWSSVKVRLHGICSSVFIVSIVVSLYCSNEVEFVCCSLACWKNILKLCDFHYTSLQSLPKSGQDSTSALLYLNMAAIQ
jgi:hypothetical protein